MQVLAAVLSVLFVTSTFANPVCAPKNPVEQDPEYKKTVMPDQVRQVSCEEIDPFGDSTEKLAQVVVTFNAKDDVIAVSLERLSDDLIPVKLKWDFNLQNAIFKHYDAYNKVDDCDDTTKPPTPIFHFGIKFVEVIEASNKVSGEGIKVIFNDHTYAGYPGGNVLYSILMAGKIVQIEKSGERFFKCSGAVHFPIKSPSDP